MQKNDRYGRFFLIHIINTSLSNTIFQQIGCGEACQLN